MGKDVIHDRYARLYEIPNQLAQLGHEVRCYCLDYHPSRTSAKSGFDKSAQGSDQGTWQHDVSGTGSLHWSSTPFGLPQLGQWFAYPRRLLGELKSSFQPDVLIGASDIPHAALTAWLSKRLDRPYVIDLYDNFEGFGQARIPGFVPALRHATRNAGLVLTTSEPLRQKVLHEYRAKGMVISMPSSVDLDVFKPQDRSAARQVLGLPLHARLIGTAGGLTTDKGIEPLYKAWELIASRYPDVHLVLAGPFRDELPPPKGERVHYLGQLNHAQVANMFCALDVGVISILDTPFGRYCFPQKAYEMLACGLEVVVSDLGEMSTLFSATPETLFSPGDANDLARALSLQLSLEVPATTSNIQIDDWEVLIKRIEPKVLDLASETRQSGGSV